MRILGVSVLGLLELTARSRESDEARHTQVERCRRSSGTLRETPDCTNAETAAALEDRMRLPDAPPIGLDKEPAPSDLRHEE